MGFGLALAAASFVSGLASSRSRERKISAAQEEQRRIEEEIRQEQAFRERRKQIRTANILRSQAEAKSLSQTETSGFGSNVLGATAGVTANLGRNISDISTSLAQGSALAGAQENIFEAGRKSTFDIFNQQLQPLIFGNIEGIDNFFSS